MPKKKPAKPKPPPKKGAVNKKTKDKQSAQQKGTDEQAPQGNILPEDYGMYAAQTVFCFA